MRGGDLQPALLPLQGERIAVSMGSLTRVIWTGGRPRSPFM